MYITLINNNIEEYAEKFCFTESMLLKEIKQATVNELEYADMLSDKFVAGLLRLLIQTGGFCRILEVGTFTGYATLAMAEVIPQEGLIDTLEMNERYSAIATRVIHKSEHSAKITFIHGNARESIEGLKDIYDLIFLDADKQYYPEYFKKLKPKLRSGGIFFADNTFWGGKVLSQDDRKSKAIHKFNEMVKKDEEMESLMLTVRDGVMIARKG